MSNDTTARPVPRWAAGLISRLSRDRQEVVTRDDVAQYLTEIGSSREPARTVNDLQKLGWLTTLHIKGVWAFAPAGESKEADPYLDLLGWQARDKDAVFALAGEAAAWHLGYVKRKFDGPPAIWLPATAKLPHGLRSFFSVVRIDWTTEDRNHLRPSPRLLRKKGLDLTRWANGLPALGPDALLAQLAVRPKSFRTWADLIAQLDVLVADCGLECLATLLRMQSAAAWQRAAYFLDRGGRREDGLVLLRRRPHEHMSSVTIGEGPQAEWSSDFRINDYLIAPIQKQLGKS